MTTKTIDALIINNDFEFGHILSETLGLFGIQTTCVQSPYQANCLRQNPQQQKWDLIVTHLDGPCMTAQEIYDIIREQEYTQALLMIGNGFHEQFTSKVAKDRYAAMLGKPLDIVRIYDALVQLEKLPDYSQTQSVSP